MAGYVPGANSAPTGADPAFPSASAADDTLYGITRALATVPIAVKRTQAVRRQDPNASIGGARPLSDRPGFDLSATPEFDIRPMEAVLGDIDHIPPGERQQIQRALFAAGYYPSSYYGANPPIIVPGEIDPAMRVAWKGAVEDAARSSVYDKGQLTHPVSVYDVIQGRIANRQSQGLAGAVTKPQVTLTSPDDIRAEVIAGAKREYGHNAPDELVNSIINRYQDLQTRAQESTSATITRPPDPSTFATQQLRSADPGAVASNRGLEIGNLFMQAFSAPAGSTPAGSGG